MKKILFWTTVVVVPGGGLLLLVEIARKFKLVDKVKKQLVRFGAVK